VIVLRRFFAAGKLEGTSMKWWKKALIGSAIWTALMVVGVFFMMHRIEREAINARHRDAWETKLGEVTVYLFTLGNAAIWGVLWSRRKKLK
jgi:hypothetical protein